MQASLMFFAQLALILDKLGGVSEKQASKLDVFRSTCTNFAVKFSIDLEK